MTTPSIAREDRRTLLSRSALLAVAAALVALLVGVVGAQVSALAPEVQLYTLNGGQLDLPNLGEFSDTDTHQGERAVMAVPCFLVRHGNDWLLWDTGLGDDLAKEPGQVRLGMHWMVKTTLAAQLAQIGLKPDDIRYVALSHLHADHSGNVGLFPHATFLIAPQELAWASGNPAPHGVVPEQVATVARATVKPVPEDLDVFGDGSVRMLCTPGHTPGHRSLLLELKHSGTVILSGDVAHTRESYERGLVPPSNTNRADSLASIARLKGLAEQHHARVVIQHAADVFDTLPVFPACLE